jgi:serine/threonine protein kinase
VANCPQCGANLRPDARFCPQCGVSLAAAGVTTGPLAAGATLQGGRYRIMGLLGQGGMGAVYLAKDVELFGRLCVIKQMQLLFASQAERKKAESDFLREAEVLVQLNTPGHPNIPEIYSYFTEAGSYYLVMKYIAGESLEARLERLGRPLDETDVVRYMLQVCDALVYLHSRQPRPVVHRDIKPANIIVDPEGRVWLVDFGLARASIGQGALVMLAGGKTVAAGTPGYTPLEQWQLQPEPKSDIYALGATIHHLLTNQDPRDRFCTFPELDLQILKELSTFRPLPELRPDVSPELAQLVDRALQSEAARRPSAGEMKKTLEKLAPSGGRALQAVQRWGPAIGKLIGAAVAAFFERLFHRRRPASELFDRAYDRPQRPPSGPYPPPVGKGLKCLYCRGSGVTKDGRPCPICGGNGYW